MAANFDNVQKHIDWARAAIQEGHAAFGATMQDGTFRFTDEFDPAVKERRYKLVLAKPLPDTITRRSTEALNNLRHSFDQALYNACIAIGQPRTAALNYPWSQNPTDLAKRLRGNAKAAEPKVPVELWECIGGQEPYYEGEDYAGGQNLLREMAKIANRKHTVGLELFPDLGSINLGLKFGNLGNEWIRNDSLSWDAAKQELTLLITSEHARIQMHPQIELHIILKDRVDDKRVPAFLALNAFADKAQSVLDDFKKVAPCT